MVNNRILYLIKELYKLLFYYPCTFFSFFIDYFHYKLLTCFEYPIFTINPASGIIGNKCYGNLWAVKNAMGCSFKPHCMIEHGLYFGDYVLEDECKLACIDTIYTYSNYRKKAILSWFGGSINKEIKPVGPYILYANHFKSKNDLLNIKKRLGKVLLVFPSHPSPGAETKYDTDSFLKEIDKVAKGYDSVLVSLFWLDIRRGYHKIYEKKGYIVVCSGIRSDRWFLSRQRDLFWLADMSMSNDVGTHVGYSVSLGVPHYIFKQKVEIIGGGEEYSKDDFNKKREREFNLIIDAFSNFNPSITQEQYNLVNYYWGTDFKNEKQKMA